jgi:transcriptional regulator with XRE-family HTH domain
MMSEIEPYRIHPLKLYRLEKGYTIEDIAVQVGYTRATISRIETGKRFAGRELAALLHDLTGIPVDEFIRRDD